MTMNNLFSDPSNIDLTLDSRSICFENPDGARGAGGKAYDGRKGAPNKFLKAGEKVVLADVEGPGTIRHIWMTFPPMRPELMRAVWMEVYYDGSDEPSLSVPCLDFFGLPHGRPVHYASALASAQEGRGFNAYFPMPFRKSVKIELTNSTPHRIPLYYQIDYTLQPELPEEAGYLHATFRRENPTTMKQDFIIADGLKGPGRFLGCAVGIRVLPSELMWYGEGEVKIYLDGDKDLPTICGTGLEDYVGSAWGMSKHIAPFAGVPVFVKNPDTHEPDPDFVSFYRWHLPDPIVFRQEIKVAIQQIGAAMVPKGQEEKMKELEKNHPLAGRGWEVKKSGPIHAFGILERIDDYCATAFLYLQNPQPVPRLDLGLAIVDIERKPYEKKLTFEIISELG